MRFSRIRARESYPVSAMAGNRSPGTSFGYGPQPELDLFDAELRPYHDHLLHADLGGSYHSAYKPPIPGSYALSASFKEDADHLGNTSPVSTFDVVR